ncbi:MAG: hypothetical protein ACM3PU_09165 [Gemmatimonadota bacterium]
MAKPNYSFEKRQRELAKKKKQEAKRERKAHRSEPGTVPAPAEETITPPVPVEKP